MDEVPGSPWSEREVRETVRAYLGMLGQELAGERVHKAEWRRRLLAVLPARTDGAVEYKHQNISAVMQTLGLPVVTGYRPAWNVQGLIAEVVRSEVSLGAGGVLGRATDLARERAATYDVDVALTTAVPTETDEAAGFAEDADAGREAVILGLAGEEWVVRWERSRLERAGRPDLAAGVDHVALTKGNGLGYDVESFDVDGRRRFIEVKTTAGAASRQFIVTPNELRVSAEVEGFRLYRVYDYWRQPGLYVRSGPLDQSFRISRTPTSRAPPDPSHVSPAS